MSLPLRHGLDNVNSIERIVEDLLVRFVINCPPEDLSSVERELFHFEEASWFYTDFIRLINPNLPSLKIKQLSQLFIKLCPVIWKWDNVRVDEALLKFSRYKKTIPVRGAAIFNENLNKILLVKGTESDSWSFPRGKISKDEDDVACCIREVKEEIGFDLTDYINDYQFIERNITGKNYKIYLVKGVSENTVFKPQARNEIEKIQWFDFKKIAKLMFKNGNSGNCGSLKFYLINSMMKPLSLWLKHERNIKNEDQLREYAEEQLKLLLGITKEESIDPGRELLNLLHSSVQKQPKANSIPPSDAGSSLNQDQTRFTSPPNYQNSMQQQQQQRQAILPQIQNNATLFGFQPFSPALFNNANGQINVFGRNNMLPQLFVPPPVSTVTPQLPTASPLNITSPPQQVALLRSPEMVVRGLSPAKPADPGLKVRLLQRGQPLAPSTNTNSAASNDKNVSDSKALLNLLHTGARKEASRRDSIVEDVDDDNGMMPPYASTDMLATSTLPAPSFTPRTVSKDTTIKPGHERTLTAASGTNVFRDSTVQSTANTDRNNDTDFDEEEDDTSDSDDNGVYYSDFEASTDSEVEEQLEEELGELETVSPIADTEYVNTKDLMQENNFKGDEIPHKDDETDTVRSVLSDPSVSRQSQRGISQGKAFKSKLSHVSRAPESNKQNPEEHTEKTKKFRILRRGETIEALNKKASNESSSKTGPKKHTAEGSRLQKMDTALSAESAGDISPNVPPESFESTIPADTNDLAPNSSDNDGNKLLSLLKKNANNSVQEPPMDAPLGTEHKSSKVGASDLLQMLKGSAPTSEANANPDLKGSLQSRTLDYQSPLLEQGSGPMGPTLGSDFRGFFDINPQSTVPMAASYSFNQPISGPSLQNNGFGGVALPELSPAHSNTFQISPSPPVMPSNGGNALLNMIKNPLQPPDERNSGSGLGPNLRQAQDVSGSNDLLNILHKKPPQNAFTPDVTSNNSPFFGNGGGIQDSQLLSFLDDQK